VTEPTQASASGTVGARPATASSWAEREAAAPRPSPAPDPGPAPPDPGPAPPDPGPAPPDPGPSALTSRLPAPAALTSRLPSAADVSDLATERPEVLVGGAFAGGLVLGLILKHLGN